MMLGTTNIKICFFEKLGFLTGTAVGQSVTYLALVPLYGPTLLNSVYCLTLSDCMADILKKQIGYGTPLISQQIMVVLRNVTN